MTLSCLRHSARSARFFLLTTLIALSSASDESSDSGDYICNVCGTRILSTDLPRHGGSGCPMSLTHPDVTPSFKSAVWGAPRGNRSADGNIRPRRASSTQVRNGPSARSVRRSTARGPTPRARRSNVSLPQRLAHEERPRKAVRKRHGRSNPHMPIKT